MRIQVPDLLIAFKNVDPAVQHEILRAFGADSQPNNLTTMRAGGEDLWTIRSSVDAVEGRIHDLRATFDLHRLHVDLLRPSSPQNLGMIYTPQGTNQILSAYELMKITR